MSLQTSKTILKIMGIIGIIFGIFGIIAAILILVGGGLLGAVVAADGTAEAGVTVGGVVVVVGIVALISAVVTLIEGICSFKASKDTSKIGPAWVFALIGIVFAVISLILAIVNNGSIASSIFSVAINALVFVAANTIKKSNAE